MECCALDFATGACGCGSFEWCSNAGERIASCEHAFTCPDHLVRSGDPCSEVGAVCPGEGADTLCWSWRCECSDSQVYECQAGTCQ